ncbi:MAG: Trm112 family protein [Nitrososphaeria archaeon]|jgi:uncharacterized protein YbaR (Trm112 family)
MDILICPVCKNYPLELHVFEKVEQTPCEEPKETCEMFCSYNNIKSSRKDKNLLLEDCKKCLAAKIKWGMVLCINCGRWFPISEEIPVMLPDDLRNVNEDTNFLKMFGKFIPSKTITEGKPTHL